MGQNEQLSLLPKDDQGITPPIPPGKTPQVPQSESLSLGMTPAQRLQAEFNCTENLRCNDRKQFKKLPCTTVSLSALTERTPELYTHIQAGLHSEDSPTTEQITATTAGLLFHTFLALATVIKHLQTPIDLTNLNRTQKELLKKNSLHPVIESNKLDETLKRLLPSHSRASIEAIHNFIRTNPEILTFYPAITGDTRGRRGKPRKDIKRLQTIYNQSLLRIWELILGQYIQDSPLTQTLELPLFPSIDRQNIADTLRKDPKINNTLESIIQIFTDSHHPLYTSRREVVPHNQPLEFVEVGVLVHHPNLPINIVVKLDHVRLIPNYSNNRVTYLCIITDYKSGHANIPPLQVTIMQAIAGAIAKNPNSLLITSSTSGHLQFTFDPANTKYSQHGSVRSVHLSPREITTTDHTQTLEISQKNGHKINNLMLQYYALNRANLIPSRSRSGRKPPVKRI